MDLLVRDIRYAVRGLARSPVFALTVVLSIGLSIGANTTVFAWMDNIVRHPFPAIPDGSDLVALNVGDQDGRVDGMPPIAYPILEEWTNRTSSFANVAAHAQARLNLRSGPTDVGSPIWVELVSSSFFDTIGVDAWQGRVFNAADQAADREVVVLSYAFWQRRFGGDAHVLGRSILLNGVPLTIVGIAPPGFGGVVMGLAFDAWVPLWQQRALVPGADWMRDRTARRVQGIARLRSGVSLSSAQRELNQVAQDVSRSLGESPLTGAGARWISDTQLGSLIGPLSLAMIAVTMVVLLTACANVAGLLLARSVIRVRQTAIQVSIGASRRHLVQQALVQAFVLAASGCGVGLAIAWAAKGSLLAFVPRVALPVSLEIDLSWRVMTFAVVASLASALLFALVPALRASRPDVVDALKATSGTGAGRSRLRQSLVVVQVTLSFVSLVIAGLFLRSVAEAGRAPLGFGDPSHVLLVSTDLSFTRLSGPALERLVERALETVQQLPAVTRASFASFVPLSFGGPPSLNTQIEGYVPGANESMLIWRASVTAGYFETMEIPILQGRAIGLTDRSEQPRVAVVNEAFVRRYWPGQEAVGRRLNQGDGWATVVGVARDTAVDSLTEPPRPLVYHPWPQTPSSAPTLHIRTSREPSSLIEPVRHTLAAAHADLPTLDPGTLADHMRAATFVQTVGASVFFVFGAIALLIATIGIHGVVAQHLAERGREIAVRVALGATPGMVTRSVASPALRLTAIGLAIGSVLAGVGTVVLRSQLVGVAALDTVSVAGSAAILIVAGLVSCAWPTWRALRLDPVEGLRAE
jgi:predicted permease